MMPSPRCSSHSQDDFGFFADAFLSTGDIGAVQALAKPQAV